MVYGAGRLWATEVVLWARLMILSSPDANTSVWPARGSFTAGQSVQPAEARVIPSGPLGFAPPELLSPSHIRAAPVFPRYATRGWLPCHKWRNFRGLGSPSPVDRGGSPFALENGEKKLPEDRARIAHGDRGAGRSYEDVGVSREQRRP